MSRPSFRVRWWHLVLLGMTLLLSTLYVGAYAWRAQGRAQYREVIAGLQQRGYPSSIDDFISRVPAVDHKRQDEWDAWQQTFISGFTDDHLASSALAKHQPAWNAWVTGHGPRPDDVTRTLAMIAGQYAPALPLLRHGGLQVSAAGWMAADLPPTKRRMPFTSMCRLSQLLAIRELAVWLHHSAVCGDDPREFLADLDALQVAMAGPATLIDAMTAITVTDIRDRAYVELALLKRLPEDAKLRWLSESGSFLNLVAAGFEGESVLMGMGAAGMLDESTMIDFTNGGKQLRIGGWIWLTGYQDCAIMVDFETHVAQRLRGQRTDRWPDMSVLEPRLGPLGRIAIPNATEAVITALHNDAGHRAARLSVRMLDLVQAGRTPADQAEFIALIGHQDLAPTGDHLHLRYEVPAPGCFRFVVDPASPVSNIDDPGRMPQRTNAAGTPAAHDPLVWSRRTGLIEIHLPTPPATP